MAPGFAILLIIVALSALAPVVFLAAIGCLSFDKLRPIIVRSLGIGVLGGTMAMAAFAAPALFFGETLQVAGTEWLMLFAAGFASFALVGFSVLLAFGINRRRI